VVDSYRSLRINEMPEVQVTIVRSDEKPTGVGEPGVPPVAPAIANAMSRLGLGRPHRLPISCGACLMGWRISLAAALIGLGAMATPALAEDTLRPVSDFAGIADPAERAKAPGTQLEFGALMTAWAEAGAACPTP
jgi:hypothetical protein